MSPEAQRIAIAEACGWSAIENHGGAGGFIAKMPNGQTLWDNRLGATRIDAIDANCPDYPTDLNAMHEAEKVLTPVQASKYGRELAKIADRLVEFNEDVQIGPLDVFAWATLTAAQRAEAFLKTLNLWDDSK